MTMFRMEDVMEELYKEFPEIEEKSINKICHDGLMGILKLARIKEEVSIKTENNEEIKFFASVFIFSLSLEISLSFMCSGDLIVS